MVVKYINTTFYLYFTIHDSRDLIRAVLDYLGMHEIELTAKNGQYYVQLSTQQVLDILNSWMSDEFSTIDAAVRSKDLS